MCALSTTYREVDIAKLNMATAKKRLLERKAELESLTAMTCEDRSPVQFDQQSVGRLSRMDSLQMQAMAQAAERNRAAEITRIENALHRIETNEYGYCLDCGEPIAQKRLEVDPVAALCIHCAGSRSR
jgi:DnaK suppressor protein